VAHEMLAQAEHDPLASVVLVATSSVLADAVASALVGLVRTAPRAAIVREALAARGGLLTADTVDEAIAFAAEYAPEHALICCRDSGAVEQLRNAGTIFVGGTSSVAFGDYMTGANHVLPTGGLARGYSGLSTLDFYRWTTWQRVDRDAAVRLA